MTIQANIELINKKQGFSYVDEKYIIKGTTGKEMIEEAKTILRETYDIAVSKTQPIFIDVPDGAIWTGFATSFWSKYIDANKRFNGEAWVTFYETKPVDLDNCGSE